MLYIYIDMFSGACFRGACGILSTYFYLMLVFVVGMSVIELAKNKYYKKHWDEYDSVGLLVGLVFFHNFVYYVLYFSVFFIIYGYFFQNKREFGAIRKYVWMYLVMCILLLLHWHTNNNMCQFTVWQNRYMQIADDEGFRDPYNVFNDIYFYKDHPYKRWRGEIYRGFIFASIGFCGWLIVSEGFYKTAGFKT